MLSLFKAKTWSGAGWLLTLCVLLVFIAMIYTALHLCYKGTDHKKLDNMQLLNIDNVIAVYPDPDSAQLASKDPAVKKVVLAKREERDHALFNFLRNEYDGRIDEYRLKRMDGLLINLNNKDTKAYLTDTEIIVNDFFWFVGTGTYAEVLFWALIGVLVSLIYYVSIANGQSLKVAGDADTGPFDPAEISGQVSKMFYAPVCALILVLGYNLLAGSNTKMTDISVGKGLLLFSFISGFFSGRVMKFIDRLKDLVLPLGSTDSTTTDDSATTNDIDKTDEKTANITISLQLAQAMLSTPEAADIIDEGFNTAVVTLKPLTGDIITLGKPADDQSSEFTATQVPWGKYTLHAAMAFKNNDTIINLEADKDIEISDADKTFQLDLDKAAEAG
ncbi:hypothetical protein SAMN05421821_10487 [Mucilaginibacter lappiensis]|uniref:Uncharacterized protein n=1 Tax=Mucilaginibacter lappiensis TaxID=354630 RepID=A0ABR6PMK1_9SPHI|nr:hypothetical protein [Mucilaginibacter lappiensis]MBB6109501.1 hypothetical protein [Mucilaginibacter lappiensis]SIQ92838.1 hypothetical protein SAMN05421821_10487 [Mucilaginibacter lappiensis]